ncbi:hypothetical protein SAMN05444672_12135 [Bacillus sp. OK838]|nr:hypothetical protein SAMN05444672_12135 [Bacillus sp. OK838]
MHFSNNTILTFKGLKHCNMVFHQFIQQTVMAISLPKFSRTFYYFLTGHAWSLPSA